MIYLFYIKLKEDKNYEKKHNKVVTTWCWLFIGVYRVYRTNCSYNANTTFLIIGAACYVKSSERFYKWLISHRYFGNDIKIL